MDSKRAFQGSYPKPGNNSKNRGSSSNISRRRKAIKLHLLNMGDKCAVCGISLSNGFHLHEAIITRGMIRGVKRLKGEIFVVENCVGVCGECHVDAHTTEGRKKCAQHLVRREGKDNIVKWLDNMQSMMKSTTLINECRSLL